MFTDRRHAGRVLGALVAGRFAPAPVVVGLPRGGVIVAAEVAGCLDAPLDMVVVRKLGAPGNPELGIGAVAEGGVTVLNEDLIGRLGVDDARLEDVSRREHAELERRVAAYRRGRAPIDLEGREVVIVDDGLATGYTARAAVASVRQQSSTRVVLAVPVAAADTASELEHLVDELICAEIPTGFYGVGGSYRDFRQTTDEEVLAALDR